MMERKIARDFQTAVKSLLEDDDPEAVYATLKAYHQVDYIDIPDLFTAP